MFFKCIYIYIIFYIVYIIHYILLYVTEKIHLKKSRTRCTRIRMQNVRRTTRLHKDSLRGNPCAQPCGPQGGPIYNEALCTTRVCTRLGMSVTMEFAVTLTLGLGVTPWPGMSVRTSFEMGDSIYKTSVFLYEMGDSIYKTNVLL